MKLPLFVIIMLSSLIGIAAYADSTDEEDLLMKKGNESLQLDKFNEAISYYDQVLQINPKNIDALNNMANALYIQDRKYIAIVYYYKVLEIDPKNEVAKLNLETIKPTLPYILVDGIIEVVIHDSQGYLVGYLKILGLKIIDDEDVKQYFKNALFERKTITHNGQEVEALQYRFIHTITFDGVAAYSGITSPDAPDVLTLFSPNSMYLLAKGDTLTFLISWFDFNE